MFHSIALLRRIAMVEMSLNQIYLTGCGDMLGEAFQSIFSAYYELKSTDIDVNEPWLRHLVFLTIKPTQTM